MSYRICSWKKVANKYLVYHGNPCRSFCVSQADFSSQKQRNSKRLRTVRADENVLNTRDFVLTRSISLYVSLARADVPTERAEAGDRHHANAGQGIEAVKQFSVGGGHFRWFIPGNPWIDAREKGAVLIETDGLMLEL
jgi:hypothetical protein